MPHACILVADETDNLKYEKDLLLFSTEENDTLMVDGLIAAQQEYRSALLEDDSLASAINALDAYFGKFSTYFAPPKETKNSKDRQYMKAIEDISSYLPLGIGTSVYKILYDVVFYLKLFIRQPFKKRIIKKYIDKGHYIVPDNLRIIRNSMPVICDSLEVYNEDIRAAYLLFLREQQSNREPADHFFSYNPLLLRMTDKAWLCDKLAVSVNNSLDNIGAEWEFLYNNTRERKKLEEKSPALPELGKQMGRIRKLSAALDTIR
ncbi:MAG: hypothetical protein ABIJ16_05085 [Bacteroidota bacterium]